MIRALRRDLPSISSLTFGACLFSTAAPSDPRAEPENVEPIQVIHLSVRSFDRNNDRSDRTVTLGGLDSFVD
jgi:hypothetical protein